MFQRSASALRDRRDELRDGRRVRAAGEHAHGEREVPRAARDPLPLRRRRAGELQQL